MKKMNFYLHAGILIVAIALFAKHVFHINEFLSGFLLGLGLTFELVGMLAMRFNIDLRKIKSRLFGFLVSK